MTGSPIPCKTEGQVEMIDGGESTRRLIAFEGHRRLRSGSIDDVTIAARAAMANRDHGTILVFDVASGDVVDLDLRPTLEDAGDQPSRAGPKPARGRPKLGVTAREVTLLPRHWEWLSTQSGGASAALRRLVDRARRDNEQADIQRAARDAAYRFISAIAGDLPNFEDASRALFSDDREALQINTTAWPADVRAQMLEILDRTNQQGVFQAG